MNRYKWVCACCADRLPDGFTQLLNLTHVGLNDISLSRLPADIGRQVIDGSMWLVIRSEILENSFRDVRSENENGKMCRKVLDGRGQVVECWKIVLCLKFVAGPGAKDVWRWGSIWGKLTGKVREFPRRPVILFIRVSGDSCFCNTNDDCCCMWFIFWQR